MKCEECPWFVYDGEGSESGYCSFDDWLWINNKDGNPPCVEEED